MIPCAVLFLPPYIMQLQNFEISVLWCIGSGTISRLTICAFLGIENLCKFKNWITGYPQPGLAPGSRVLATADQARGKLSLRPLCAILGSRLLTIGDPSCVERSTDYMVTNARKVLNTTSTDQDDGVFLQIVADTGDVGCNFNPIGQT